MVDKNSCDVATKEDKELQSLEGNIHIVRIGLKSIVRGFYTVGKTLSDLQSNESYKLKGYKNFYDFTLSAFSLSKSHTSRLINVYNRFPGPNHENFSFSQLSEMLTLPDDKLEEIKPEMTIKQIREVKKDVKKDNIIKKKDKIEFCEQVNIIDIAPNDFNEIVNVSQEIEGLEAANNILKNRKESLEIKYENFKKINKEKIKEKMEEIDSLKCRLEFSKKSIDNLIERDNKQINELKNENANLLSQLADMQKIQKENEKLKKENEKIKKEKEKLKKELLQSDKDYKQYLEKKENEAKQHTKDNLLP